MIAAPAGWRARRQGDGLVLQRGPTTIAYRECVQPMLAPDDVTRLGATEWLVTHEGEHAALVRTPAHVLGVIFLDTYCALLHAPLDVADVVRELVLSDAHMLGIRRRAFRYAPPRGWSRTACAFETHHVAPDRAAAIVVQHAWPMHSPVVLDGDPVTTSSGLTGSSLRIGERTIVLLHDDRYVYPIRLDGADRAPLLELVDSVQPIPYPRRASSPLIADALGYAVH
jgi:hypothetical protein